MNPMTKQQQRIYNFIVGHTMQHGYPPTRKEIAKEFGFKSHNGAQEHLLAIQKKGYLTLTKGASRGISVLPTTSGTTVGQNDEKQA